MTVAAEPIATPPDAPTPPAPPPPPSVTARAVLIGVLIAAGLAVLTPWNDWYLKNTFLYSNYMPPALTALLLLVGLVVNPLLGARRLRTGELVVVTVMALGVGGIASSGLMRLWPAAVAGSARHLDRNPSPHLRERIAAPDGSEAWRYALPPGLFLGIPEMGDIPVNDAEHKHVVDGYLDGLPKAAEPRVGHRARVTWVDAAGVRHEGELALSGSALARARAEGATGVLDLDDPLGRALAGLKAGQTTPVPGGEAAVVAVDPPGVPWSAWIAPLLAWAPLLLGTIVASVGMAFLVRRQWIENERLPYPIAAVALTLMGEPEGRSRLAPIFRDRAFLIGLAVAATIIAWRGLFRLHVISVDFLLDVDLIYAANAPFSAATFHQMMEPGFLFHPTLYLSMLALAFFLPLDLSFSLWATFVLANLAAWSMREVFGMGAVVTWPNCRSVGYGAFLSMAPLIVWLGRRYYLRVLRAAFAGSGDEQVRAAVPYVWATLAGSVAIGAFFVAHGAPVLHAALMTLLFLGCLLVIARVLAEAGVPFLQVPMGINSLMFTLVGFNLPVGALVALATVGITLLPDGRESLMPYAANASYLGHEARVPHRRLAGLMVGAAALAVVLSLGSMLWNSYGGAGHQDGWAPYAGELQNIEARKGELENPASAERVWQSRSEQLAGYGIGAAAVATCGVGRMLWSGWPLHPLAWCVTFTYPGGCSWFSFFLAWLAKGLVMRYGGVGLYKRLKPLAIGLIAGEAAAMAVFLVVKIVASLFDVQLQPFNALPG